VSAGVGVSAAPTTAPPVRRAALWVPDWPVVAAMAQAGLGSETPAAVLHGRGMLAVSAAARAAGVRRGMRKRQAQRACPELAILPHDEGRDARAFEEVALGAEVVVSGIEVTRPGLLMIPAGGAARFHGGERALVEALVVAATERSGAEVNVGIADGLLAAVEAARESLIVPPGASPAYLAPLPASTLTHVAVERRHLASVEDLVSVLDRLGIRTLGDFAALPFADVLARFGSVGAWAHRLASGGDLAPPVLRRTEQDIAVRYDFEDPPTNVEQAAFVARHVAGLLDSALRDAGVRCLRVSIAVATERGEELERTWRTDVGPREGAFARHMADRVRWQLEGWLSGITLGPEASALTAITLTARDVIGGGAEQAFLWGGVSGADGRAHRAMERIQGLAGAEAVLVATEQGGRSPRDRASLIPFGQVGRAARRVDRPWPGQLPDPAPATVLVAPEPVRVLDAGGRDVVVTERLYVSAAPTWVAMPDAEPEPVDAWAGPWPVVERWWSEDASRRAYLQVALRDGRAVLVASRQGQWTLEAVYD